MDSAAHGPDQPKPASGKPDAAAAARERKPVLLARLDRLGTLAMDLAERTQVLAMRATDRDIAALDAAPPDSPALPAESNGPVLSFARASRVARDCIAMELRIAAGDAADDDASDRRISPAARRRLTAMKNEVRGQVEGAIRAHAEPLLVDRLLLDLDERLDDPDVEAEFGVLTIGQMVLSVCRDLHVKPEMRLMPEDMLQTAISAHYGTPMPPPAAAHHGMTKGMAADPTVEKLPTGVIGSPGVPPAIDLPPWPNQPPQQQSPQPPPPDTQRNGGAVQDSPAAPRRPPGSFFAR
jgi:hypothetical protein